MWMKVHEDMQNNLDQTIDSTQDIDVKIEQIKKYLQDHHEELKQMFFSYFDKNTLGKEQYYYMTYTYHDEPFDMFSCNEIVVSLLYDHDQGFYYELAVFNYRNTHEEKTMTFSGQVN